MSKPPWEISFATIPWAYLGQFRLYVYLYDCLSNRSIYNIRVYIRLYCLSNIRDYLSNNIYIYILCGNQGTINRTQPSTISTFSQKILTNALHSPLIQFNFVVSYQRTNIDSRMTKSKYHILTQRKTEFRVFTHGRWCRGYRLKRIDFLFHSSMSVRFPCIWFNFKVIDRYNSENKTPDNGSFNIRFTSNLLRKMLP